jgi:hypothetical protein
MKKCVEKILSNLLKKENEEINNFKYDFVVRSRLDLDLLIPINLKDPHLISEI